MKLRKIRTYFDVLLENKEFRKDFEREYKRLILAEKVADLRISFIPGKKTVV